MGNYLDGYAKAICGHCGEKRTHEGHDGCIGTLPGIMNACCGHGESSMAYVQFWDGECIRNDKALNYINKQKMEKTKQLLEIEKQAKEQFKNFRQFCIQTGRHPINFKRTLNYNLIKINKWIEPLGLEIEIKKTGNSTAPGKLKNQS